MPVVISLLNAFTGLAASATGFVLHNNVLIVSGALVGRLGHAADDADGPGDEPVDRERPLRRVRPGPGGHGRRGDQTAERALATPEDVAIMLAYARRVVVVPGYGLAVAQAQHDVRALATCSRSVASTSPTRSIRSRGACRGT